MGNNEKPKFKSPEYKLVTERTYEQYLEFFSIPENCLKGKRILDIGSGFSNFVEETNRRLSSEETKAIGVDPIYAFFDDDFQKFKNSLGDSQLSLDLTYGRKPSNATWNLSEWGKAIKKFYSDFYREVKSSGTYMAGSHQELPFKDESVDLIIGSNSVVSFKDKRIVKKALRELTRVLKKGGEIRLLPINLEWREAEKNICLIETGEMSRQSIEKMRRAGKFPGPKLLDVLKELEESGIKLYSFATRSPAKYPEKGLKIYFNNIILRKDEEIPQVDEGASDFYELRRLYPAKSPDQFYIPSEVVKVKSCI